jgi:hypothetical protein
MVCFIEGNELVGIKDADFGFELLPESEILISLKGSSLYLQKQILDKFSCRENNTNFQDSLGSFKVKIETICYHAFSTL